MAKTKKHKKTEMYEEDDLLHKREATDSYRRHKRNKKIRNAIRSKDIDYLLSIDEEDY